MSARYDSALGMWIDDAGGYHATQSEAIQANQNNLDAGDFFMGSGGITAQAPDAPARAPSPADQPNPSNPGGISDNELRRRQEALRTSATNTANINVNSDRTSGQGGALSTGAFAKGGWYDNLPASSKAQYEYMHELGSPGAITSARQVFNTLGERAGVSHAGDAIETNPFAGGIATSPEDLMGKWYRRTTDPNTGLGQTLVGDTGNAGRPIVRQATQEAASRSEGGGAPGATGGFSTSTAPGFDQGAGRTGIDKETEDAKNRAGAVIEENRDENAQLFADAFARYDNLAGSDYGLSDEARGYQREGLAQQRMLLDKMLGFNEDQYATRFQDQALARQIAAARSAGGGYASQQAGTFAAMEQAPALYAEGQRQAASLANQRLQMAESAAKAFGDLGTMTRGQDEARAQFESNLGVQIADSVARLTEGNVQMNDRDSAQMAEIWMDFAKLQSVYEGMTSDEQLAWWQQETARRGQDKQFEAIIAQLKSQGAVSSKDLIGGLFQLGGGLITTGGTLGAASIASSAANARAAA